VESLAPKGSSIFSPPPNPINGEVILPKKRGRPFKSTPPETKSTVAEKVKSVLGVGEEEAEDPEVTKARTELLKFYLVGPDFYPTLDEKKIAALSDLETIQRQLELGQLRMLGTYNTQLSKTFLKAVNVVPKALLRMNPTQAAQLEENIAHDEPFQVLTKFQFSSQLFNLVPTFVKWVSLYALNIFAVYYKSDTEEHESAPKRDAQ
jgi:hypothetical protein